MGKYRRGDVVRVRNDIVVGESYHGRVFSENMRCLLGEPVKILIPPLPGLPDKDLYYVTELYNDRSVFDRSCYFLTEDMLEEAEDHHTFYVGDIVRVREDLRTHTGYCMNGGGVPLLAVGGMIDLRGSFVTITDKYQCGDLGYYRVSDMNGSSSPYKWTDEMFDDYVVRSENDSDAAQAEELCVLYEWIPEVMK